MRRARCAYMLEWPVTAEWPAKRRDAYCFRHACIQWTGWSGALAGYTYIDVRSVELILRFVVVGSVTCGLCAAVYSFDIWPGRRWPGWVVGYVISATCWACARSISVVFNSWPVGSLSGNDSRKVVHRHVWHNGAMCDQLIDWWDSFYHAV